MTNCKYLTKNGRCGLKGSYAYRHGCFGEDMCRCREPMTNADRINSMTIEEKAEFLSSVAYGRETPWSKPFLEKFCKASRLLHLFRLRLLPMRVCTLL